VVPPFRNGDPRPFVFVWKDSLATFFKISEKREEVLAHLQWSTRIGVVVDKQSRGYVERDEHVDGVMFMSSENEKHPKDVRHPTKDVQSFVIFRCVSFNEVIQQRQYDSVTTAINRERWNT
jgi:hypothetical protein